MGLESIMLYLNKKGLAAVEIHTEISYVLGEGTTGYSAVTRYLRKQSLEDSSTLPREDREIQGPEAIDNAILQMLDEQAFVSLRQIAKRILIPMSTVRYCLVSKMPYTLKHCKWAPHTLSGAQKQTRVTAPKSFLDLLPSIQHWGWKYIVMLDKA
jgi:hypothetical protein